MKVLITNGPRYGEVVDVQRGAADLVLIDPIPPTPVTLDASEIPASVAIRTRRYVWGRVASEAYRTLRLQYGADAIMYDPDQAKHDDAASAERKRIADLEPVERMALEIELSGFHDHQHCMSCDQDGEYPCCAALRDADSRIASR